MVTEKAYPEDEVVLSTAVNANGAPGNETHIIHEQRFGVNNQIEVDVPIEFQDQNRVWYGGVGDATLGAKRVMYSNLDSGSILSLFGGLLVPSGNRARGFGSGTTTFETFAAFDQLFKSDTFIQTQFGAELPFHTSIAPQQEKALLDFVDHGGGFVPLHCASFCFLNSPKYIELVGAQFKSHGTGVDANR